MVKIVKKKKKLRLEGVISIVFVVSIFMYFMSVTVLRAHNAGLAKQEQDLEMSNEIVDNEVANLKLEVKGLEDKNRILSIAEEEGLKQNQENIVSVKND